MMTSYFSAKVWAGKKQGKKTTPESLLRFLAIAAPDPWSSYYTYSASVNSLEEITQTA